jgi:hypothetical protein
MHTDDGERCFSRNCVHDGFICEDCKDIVEYIGDWGYFCDSALDENPNFDPHIPKMFKYFVSQSLFKTTGAVRSHMRYIGVLPKLNTPEITFDTCPHTTEISQARKDEKQWAEFCRKYQEYKFDDPRRPPPALTHLTNDQLGSLVDCCLQNKGMFDPDDIAEFRWDGVSRATREEVKRKLLELGIQDLVIVEYTTSPSTGVIYVVFAAEKRVL